MNIIIHPAVSSVAIDEKLAELPLEERQVVIHINHHPCFQSCVSSGACSVCLNSTIYLLPNTVSTPSLLVHAINAELLDNMMILKKDVMNFTLIFSGLPKDATSFDNQTKSITDIVYGEYTKASANKKLNTMTLDGLPAKPVRKAEVKFTLTIDKDGKVHNEKISLENEKKK